MTIAITHPNILYLQDLYNNRLFEMFLGIYRSVKDSYYVGTLLCFSSGILFQFRYFYGTSNLLKIEISKLQISNFQLRYQWSNMTPRLISLIVWKGQSKVGLAGYNKLFAYIVVEVKNRRIWRYLSSFSFFKCTLHEILYLS